MIRLLNRILNNVHTEYVEIRNEKYKTREQLTKEDYALIDMDRNNTGIMCYSDEYYYNHILFYNFDRVKKSA